jgi:penicillin-binding protein A
VNAPLRRVGVVMLILFGLLFANLNYVQAYKADDYRTSDQNNARVQVQEYERARGGISVGAELVAKSVATNDTLKYRRVYPFGPMYAHVVGYKSVSLGATAIEKWQNDFLAGTADTFAGDRVLELFTGQHKPGGNVLLTLSKQVQETAYKELVNNDTGAQQGAVVALDPTTGAILAMVSTPSFDPNALSTHDGAAALAAAQKLQANKLNPLLNRAVADNYPPGSTFKVVVATAALQAGLNPDTVITGGTSYTAPDTSTPINNAPGVVCPATIKLRDALRVSCNTAFARLGVEQVGADRLRAAAEAFGFGTVPQLDGDKSNVMRVTSSETGTMTNPDGQVDRPALAQSCIGQRDVRMTPLQGALIAAAIANNGVQMRPYLIDTLQGPELQTVAQASPSVLRTPVSPELAAQLRDMMFGVVQAGTGVRAQIEGYDVGGKTGTAQNGDNPDHGWFIGFAMKDGRPIVAVAVFLQNAGAGGSRDATQIAGQVMRAAIAAKGVK